MTIPTFAPVLWSPDELAAQQAAGSIVVIDTRDPQAYAAEHISGA